MILTIRIVIMVIKYSNNIIITLAAGVRSRNALIGAGITRRSVAHDHNWAVSARSVCSCPVGPII